MNQKEELAYFSPLAKMFELTPQYVETQRLIMKKQDINDLDANRHIVEDAYSKLSKDNPQHPFVRKYDALKLKTSNPASFAPLLDYSIYGTTKPTQRFSVDVGEEDRASTYDLVGAIGKPEGVLEAVGKGIYVGIVGTKDVAVNTVKSVAEMAMNPWDTLSSAASIPAGGIDAFAKGVTDPFLPEKYQAPYTPDQEQFRQVVEGTGLGAAVRSVRDMSGEQAIDAIDKMMNFVYQRPLETGLMAEGAARGITKLTGKKVPLPSEMGKGIVDTVKTGVTKGMELAKTAVTKPIEMLKERSQKYEAVRQSTIKANNDYIQAMKEFQDAQKQHAEALKQYNAPTEKTTAEFAQPAIEGDYLVKAAKEGRVITNAEGKPIGAKLSPQEIEIQKSVDKVPNIDPKDAFKSSAAIQNEIQLKGNEVRAKLSDADFAFNDKELAGRLKKAKVQAKADGKISTHAEEKVWDANAKVVMDKFRANVAKNAGKRLQSVYDTRIEADRIAPRGTFQGGDSVSQAKALSARGYRNALNDFLSEAAPEQYKGTMKYMSDLFRALDAMETRMPNKLYVAPPPEAPVAPPKPLMPTKPPLKVPPSKLEMAKGAAGAVIKTGIGAVAPAAVFKAMGGINP